MRASAGSTGPHVWLWCFVNKPSRAGLVSETFNREAQEMRDMRPAPPASAGRHRCATIRRPISSFPGPVQQQLVHACLLSSLLSEDRRPIDTLPLAVPRCKVPQSRMASATEINQSQTTRPAYLRVASTLRLPTGYRHDLFTHHPHRIPRHRLRTFDADRNTANTPVDAHRLAARRDNTTHHAHPLRQTLIAPTRAHREVRAFTAFILIRGTQQVPPLMQ